MVTDTTADDQVAAFSSRGPTLVDMQAKPDLVAPGSHIVSLASAGSTLAGLRPQDLVPGTGGLPYLTLSGTSMAAPAVSGTIARMLQANPTLTPNLVKAVLQYTSVSQDGVDALTQGAGFLNVDGAVRLARFLLTAREGDAYPLDASWSRHIVWGNFVVSGGVLRPDGSA